MGVKKGGGGRVSKSDFHAKGECGKVHGTTNSLCGVWAFVRSGGVGRNEAGETGRAFSILKDYYHLY